MFSRLAIWFSIVAYVSAFNTTSKRGLAFSAAETPGDLVNANQTKSQASWVYDWSNSPAIYLTQSNLEFIPMQWGSSQIEGFQEVVTTQGAKTVLVFNEPDYDHESNILPDEAAQLWLKYIQPLKALGVRLGGPAVTGSSGGQAWLQAFFEACTNCSIDFLPLHWYGEGLGSFYDYLGTIHNTYPHMPIWVTEYASTSVNRTEVLQFLNASTIYMDNLDWVERYAWFGYFRPKKGEGYALLTTNGSLSDLGQRYTCVKTIHTQIVTPPPTPTYHTVNGADDPNLGFVTTYPAYIGNGSRSRWEPNTLRSALGAIIITCIIGTTWTVL